MHRIAYEAAQESPSAVVLRRNAVASPPAEHPYIVELRAAILAKLIYSVGRSQQSASARDWFVATALAVRDRIVDLWVEANDATRASAAKRVYYLSLEFLIGRLLFDTLNNLGLTESVRAALQGLGVDVNEVRAAEPDAALGNGGLGRLAACFMESMASLAIPGFGYGIRYEHGLFDQVLKDGWQQEYPEDWLSFGNPWEFPHPEVVHSIGFGGTVEAIEHQPGVIHYVWHPSEVVEAVAFDTPVVGWRGRHVNTLRLWSARAPNQLRLDAFNRGDHIGAHADRVKAGAISDVLYPSDSTAAGQELRLRQEYFFSSASLQDLVRRHLAEHGDIATLADKVAIQLNDTHPAFAVAELMRILIDLHRMPWEQAWAITVGCTSYTNHTLLPEALETWPVPLLERLLPRHMQIIYLINALHLDSVRTRRNDPALLSALSLIDESNGRRVRMSHLAFIGSHRTNGVSRLHTQLMRQTVFRDLHSVHPQRIIDKTNGITFRRWLHLANPKLMRLIADAVGDIVYDDPDALGALAPFADDAGVRDRAAAIRWENKTALAEIIAEKTHITVDPNALFDVQIKRIHEYKRQLLNVLETIAVYNAIRAEPTRDWLPCVKIFAGKAAATYDRAKLIIKLVNDVAHVINTDPTVRDLLKVVFLPKYNVSLAEAIIPAADLSEQISTAGMEASGTGNMKLALNGAITIGTLDGANVEIEESVGDENIFIFGLTAEEIEVRRTRGYNARATVDGSPMLAEVLDAIASGVFSPDDPSRYRHFVEDLVNDDAFFVTADFDAYYARQRDVFRLWRNKPAWWRASILNTANTGWFSSDRAIREYATDIWNTAPILRLNRAGPDNKRGHSG